MRPTGHIHSASIALALLLVYNDHISLTNMILFLCGSILVDIDIIFSYVSPSRKNHRKFLTHYPPIYLILILVFVFLEISSLVWFIGGVLFHLCFDWFDWGLPYVPLYPNAKLTPHLLTEPVHVNDEMYFFEEYWSNKIILILEAILFLGFICSIFILPLNIILVIVVIDIFLTFEIVLHLSKLRTIKA